MAGIYIHIPFCRQACHYCNFYFTTSVKMKDDFVEALLKEIELSAAYITEPVTTLYFGGGTPSLLHQNDFVRILEQLGRHFDISRLQEFTIETNPDDLTEEKLTGLSTLTRFGLNRFSIGVQSFHNEDLAYMNRAHNAQEALDAIKRTQDKGFELLTIDLIYGTPTMTHDKWAKNLEIAKSLHVPHLSSYALTVEAKTTLDKKIKKGEAANTNDENTSHQFDMLMQFAKEHHYDHYEISNFALPGKHAIHNTNYWRGIPYLGLGPSAHSFNGTNRSWNVSNLKTYTDAIAKGSIPFEEEMLTPVQRTNEKIMTSLRTMWGLPLSTFAARQQEFIESLQEINPEWYLLKDGSIYLTNEGKHFADRIAATLFLEE
jgi:oxygen-independent coproporphyrinogen-3 oxidase